MFGALQQLGELVATLGQQTYPPPPPSSKSSNTMFLTNKRNK
jgi:hypothetical protein